MIKGVRIVFFTLAEPMFDYYYCLYMKPKHCKYPTKCMFIIIILIEKCPIIMDARCIKSFSKKKKRQKKQQPHLCAHMPMLVHLNRFFICSVFLCFKLEAVANANWWRAWMQFLIFFLWRVLHKKKTRSNHKLN